MSIRVDKTKCIGCRRCMAVCPGSLIYEKDKKAYIRYPKDCWGCVSCVKECPVGAIEFFLGADIGGKGGTMTVTCKEELLCWKIKKQNGETITIDINKKDANKY